MIIKYKVNSEPKVHVKTFETDDVNECKKAIKKSLNKGDEIQFIDIVQTDPAVEYLKNMFNMR